MQTERTQSCANYHSTMGSFAVPNGAISGRVLCAAWGALKNCVGLDSVVEEKIEFDTVVEFARGLQSVCEWTKRWGCMEKCLGTARQCCRRENRIGHCCRICTWAPQRLRMDRKKKRLVSPHCANYHGKKGSFAAPDPGSYPSRMSVFFLAGPLVWGDTTLSNSSVDLMRSETALWSLADKVGSFGTLDTAAAVRLTSVPKWRCWAALVLRCPMLQLLVPANKLVDCIARLPTPDKQSVTKWIGAWGAEDNNNVPPRKELLSCGAHCPEKSVSPTAGLCIGGDD